MRLTYLFDPLCGWCYGASPVIQALAAHPGVQLEYLPTGLFSGAGARVLDASFAAYAWANDQRIASLTGLDFSPAYRSQVLDSGTSRFDSQAVALAVVAAGLIDPTQEGPMLKRLQHARYVEGRDTGEASVVAEIVWNSGISTAAPEPTLTAYQARLAAAAALMRRFGLRGVPALLAGEGENRRLVPSDLLFQSADAVLASLR